MSSDVDNITTKLAVLETEMKNVSHDVRNFGMALQQLVSHSTFKDYVEHRAETHKELKDRVEKLEANQARAAWGIIGAWLAGIGVVVKFFGHN